MNNTQDKLSNNDVVDIKNETANITTNSPNDIKSEIQNKLKNNPNAAVAAALMNSTFPVKNSTQSAPPQRVKIIKTFEVVLYEQDEGPDGSLIDKLVDGGRPQIIHASSRKDLMEQLELYRQCGQIPKVKETGLTKYIDLATNKEITAKEASDLIHGVQPSATNNVNLNNQSSYQQQSQTSSQIDNITNNITNNVIKTKPTYYKVGDIDIKNDNGKIYQKQWMKLSDSEASNIRLVNDKNNAIVNINGKHFEMKRWVLVETSDMDESTQLEENLK